MKSHLNEVEFKLDTRRRHEAKTARAELATALVDDYTREEFMADICTPEEPCDICLARSMFAIAEA